MERFIRYSAEGRVCAASAARHDGGKAGEMAPDSGRRSSVYLSVTHSGDILVDCTASASVKNSQLFQEKQEISAPAVRHRPSHRSRSADPGRSIGCGERPFSTSWRRKKTDMVRAAGRRTLSGQPEAAACETAGMDPHCRRDAEFFGERGEELRRSGSVGRAGDR